MTEDIYKVQLENIFEGPMDLLVYLIRKNEVDIYEIPISLITDRYLAYIEWMKSMNVNIAGDFLVMAATLVQIKSRMLLPTYGAAEDEDPLQEITRPLIEYLHIKSSAQQLNGRDLLGEHVFSRSHAASLQQGLQEREVQVDLFDLMQAFQHILENLSFESLDVVPEKLSVQERMTEIRLLIQIHGTLTFHEMLEGISEKSMVIVTFLAILEMVKCCMIRVTQHVDTGIIRVFLITSGNFIK